MLNCHVALTKMAIYCLLCFSLPQSGAALGGITSRGKRQPSQKIAPEAKRISNRLRQQAHRAAQVAEAAQKARALNAEAMCAHRAAQIAEAPQKARAANAEAMRAHRAAQVAEAPQKARAANAEVLRAHRAALSQADRQKARAANAEAMRSHRAAQVADLSGVLQQEKQSAGQRTEHDFDAQAKQKIRDFISPSNMGRDTCACSSYIHLHASSPAPANIAYGPDNIISNTSLLVPLHLPIHIIYISQTPIYPLAVSIPPFHSIYPSILFTSTFVTPAFTTISIAILYTGKRTH